MKHNKKYLKTILTKILRTDVLASFNKDNPFSKIKKYSRTSHVRIYNKGLKHSTVEDVFSQEDIVSGVINMKGHLLVCFEESPFKGIGVHPLILDDIKGFWKCFPMVFRNSPTITSFKCVQEQRESIERLY